MYNITEKANHLIESTNNGLINSSEILYNIAVDIIRGVSTEKNRAYFLAEYKNITIREY